MTRDLLRAAAQAEVGRWERALEDELLRVFDRQEQVVLARLQGTKARKHTRHWEPPGERKIDPAYVLDPARWVEDATAAVSPLIRRLYDEVYRRVEAKLEGRKVPRSTSTVCPGCGDEVVWTGDEWERPDGSVSHGEPGDVGQTHSDSLAPPVLPAEQPPEDDDGAPVALLAAAGAAAVTVRAAGRAVGRALGLPTARERRDQLLERRIQLRLDRISDGIRTAAVEVQELIARLELEGVPMDEIARQVRELYDRRRQVWVRRITTSNTTGAINEAGLEAARLQGALSKQWLSSRDDRVRDTHDVDGGADGQVRPLDEPFRLGGIPSHPAVSLLMYPGDPDGPADEVMGCRCTLLFRARPAPAGRKDLPELEVKAKVRTAAGAAAYGLPIGATIVPDLSMRALPRIGKLELESAGRDPEVRLAIAARAKARGEAVPDPKFTRAIAAWDSSDRLGGFVVWQSEDGGAVPKGTVLQVFVDPRERGAGVGDQLAEIAARVDPSIRGVRQTRAQPQVATTATPVAGARASAPPVAAPRVGTRGAVRDRTQAGDTPGTSGDFDRDAARIDRLQKAYLRDGADTQSLYARGGRWSKERERQQQEVIDHFLAKPTVKSDRKILVLGGLPGSGKTTTINSAAGQAALGIDLDDYVEVNADEVKAEMIRRGMVPDYPGLTADEAATLYHAESFEVAHSLMRQAAKRRLNFAYDTSLKSAGQLGFATAAGSATSPPPFETTVLFVDVPLAVAKQRARDRYLAGGRYMPLALIDGMRASGRASSRPSEQFETVKGGVDRWVRVDNSGTDPVVVDSGGRRARRAAPAPVAAPPVPRAAPTSPAPAFVPSAPAPVVTVGMPANTALPPVPAGAIVYAHPQGKVAYVLPNGSMQVWKPDGKKATTSATPAKLAAGYGGWSLVAASPDAPAPAAGAGPAAAAAPPLVAQPTAPLSVQASTPAPAGSMVVVPMDFNEADLADVPRYIADPDYVFQQKVDGIRGVLVVEPGRPPWFAGKKGDRLQSTTAAKITTPMLAKMPPTPPGSPGYRVEGELLNGKFHVFDMTVTGSEALPYDDRQRMAQAWAASVAPVLPGVEALPVARTPAEKQALWDAVQASGAEGVMMKRRDAPYVAGARVSTTLKAKITATADVEVLALGIGGKANAEIGLRIGGQTRSIGTVSTNGKGPIKVGDVVEVEYLWATADSSLAQPRIVRARPDKTPADVTDSSQLRVVDKTVLAVARKRMQWLLEQKLLEV